MINFEEFKKMDLRVATVSKAEKVDGSDKLLKLKLDLGGEERQLVSGIAKFYQPEELEGKQIVIIANLESRIIFGLESQGMLLAAGEDIPALLTTDKSVPAGTKIN